MANGFSDDKNSTGLTVSDYVAAMADLKDDELDFIEKLGELSLSNATKLAMMNRKSQQELLNAAADTQTELINKLGELKRKQIEEEYREQTAARVLLSEEEFKAKYKQSTKEFQQEKDRRLQLVAAEVEARKKIANKENKIEQVRKNKQYIEDAKAKAKAEKDALKQMIFSMDFKTLGWKGWSGAVKDLFGPKQITEKDENGNEIVRTQTKGEVFKDRLAELSNVLGDFTKQLDNTITEVANYQSKIDTRLQGSKNDTTAGGIIGNGKSYWNRMSRNITAIAGASPFISQQAITQRVSEMVGRGIAFNVEQRATLSVLKDKIATTFDATNGTLLRLIRIQQQDTTAGRLGMESALTAFLNNMYETTEYMEGIASSVRDNLNEAMSLMTGENALSFEYQIQKWLGSLYSVGMSDSAVQGLAGVLGNVAAGKLSGLTSGGQSNLVIMAANQAGLSISDIMSNGLDETTTNQLLQSMVNYLAGLYQEAGDSRVIQQQIADVYGMSASDLKAAVNLATSAVTVANNSLSYSDAVNRLAYMTNTMGQRTSMGEALNNAWSNVKYSLGAGIANNPVLYATYKLAGLLEGVTGGIDFGTPLVMGTGMTQTFNVANIMRTAALSGSILQGMGNLLGIGNGHGSSINILKALGITDGIATVSRGSGLTTATSGGAQVSTSGIYKTNGDTSSITEKTFTDTTDETNNKTASAVDSTDSVDINDVNNSILQIYNIIYDITTGVKTARVELTDISGAAVSYFRS